MQVNLMFWFFALTDRLILGVRLRPQLVCARPLARLDQRIAIRSKLSIIG
jgi:hypothetical protein